MDNWYDNGRLQFSKKEQTYANRRIRFRYVGYIKAENSMVEEILQINQNGSKALETRALFFTRRYRIFCIFYNRKEGANNGAKGICGISGS